MLVGAMPGGFRHRLCRWRSAVRALPRPWPSACCRPRPPIAATALPDGDGPWTPWSSPTGVAARGPPDRHDRARRAGTTPAFRLAATLPRYPSSCPATGSCVDGRPAPRPDSPYGEYLERTGRGRHAPRRRPRRSNRAPSTRAASSRPCAGTPRTALRARPARARGGAGGRDPDRAARPRRPRPRRRLHDGGRQPRRRDLRLEHRDRRGRRRGAGRPAWATPALGADDRWRSSPTSRSPERRRRSFARRRWPASSCSRARVGPCGTCRGGARLGGRAAAARRPGADRRRRVPAVVPRDRGPHRLGDAADRTDRVGWRRPRAPLAGREPRRVAGRAGGHAAGRPRVVRPARPDLARRQPGSSCRSSRRRWPPASWPWAAGVARRLGAPRSLAAILAFPGWVALDDHGRGRPVRRRCAVRERHARPAARTSSRRSRRVGAVAASGVAAPSAAKATRRPPHPRRHRMPRPEARGTRPSNSVGAPDPASALVALASSIVLTAAVVVERPSGAPDRDGSRRRAGRRDPRRGLARRAPAHRWRTGSRPAARRARSADPAVGSPARRRRPVAPARGPRRRAGHAARAVSRGTHVRAGDARARSRIRGVGSRTGRTPTPGASSPPGIGCPSTTSRSRSCGRARVRCPASHRTPAPGSTTCRSSCSARWPAVGSCSRATSSRRSIPSCWRASDTWTC